MASLALTADCRVIRAVVLYSGGVPTSERGATSWIFWSVVRTETSDAAPLWLAHAHSDARHRESLPLTRLGGSPALTAHQFKGLAVALGIWRALRAPQMRKHAGLFSQQAISVFKTLPLAQYLDSPTHFGLSHRAASGEWIWGAPQLGSHHQPG